MPEFLSGANITLPHMACIVVGVSVPSMMMVGEEDGNVLVCATLSVFPLVASTANPITVLLTTVDAMPSGNIDR